jgi:hypothetical protein
MENPEFIGQSPFDAHYAVFLGSAAANFRTDRFTVVERQVETFDGGVSVELAIIGESHFVLVRDRAGDVKAVELLACVQVADLSVMPTRSFSLRQPLSGSWQLEQGSVTLCANVRVEDDRDPDVNLGMGLCFTPTVELTHAFPGPCAPRTYVALHRDHSGRLYLSTVHEYVRSDFRIVPIMSNTLIQLEEE